VLVASASAAGEAMRGRFGRLSIVGSDASAPGAVACSSCRRFFADLSSLFFFVFADFGVFAMFSVDMLCGVCMLCGCRQLDIIAVAREQKKNFRSTPQSRRLHMPKQF